MCVSYTSPQHTVCHCTAKKHNKDNPPSLSLSRSLPYAPPYSVALHSLALSLGRRDVVALGWYTQSLPSAHKRVWSIEKCVPLPLQYKHGNSGAKRECAFPYGVKQSEEKFSRTPPHNAKPGGPLQTDQPRIRIDYLSST